MVNSIPHKNIIKVAIVVVLLTALSILIVATRHTFYQYHSIFREFYFIPLILAAFWFGWRGAVLASCSITLFYGGFLALFWQGMSAEKVNAVIEIVFLNILALILGVLRDRERRERLRTQQIEKLALIGKTVSGIAHDMKIPLVAIAGFAKRILKKLPEDNPHREQLTVIHQEAQRLETMVQDMLEYARPLKLRLSREPVNQIIQESVKLVQQLAEAKQATMVLRLSGDHQMADVDPHRMKQVLVNLLTNAIQASPPEERIVVASGSQGDQVVIEVTDRGTGLTAEQKEHLFTPFFTTKKEGVGLGLVMVKNIVAAHGGQISFFDNPAGAGVTFRVVIPENAEVKPATPSLEEGL